MADDAVRDFARHIKDLGFCIYIAQEGEGRYGFITDDTASRVLSFSLNDGGNLGGNYSPPSRESGTGWRMDEHPGDLKTAEDVRKALYAYPPQFAGKGWKTLTTVEQYLAMYDRSSHYAKFDN